MQDFLNIVASKGAYLVTRPNTPVQVSREVEIEKFTAALISGLESIYGEHEIRRRKYGDAAFEYLRKHTPPKLVEEREKELGRLYALMDAPSPLSDCGNGDETDRKADLKRRKEMIKILYKSRSNSLSTKQVPIARLPTL